MMKNKKKKKKKKKKAKKKNSGLRCLIGRSVEGKEKLRGYGTRRHLICIDAGKDALSQVSRNKMLTWTNTSVF